MYPFVVQWIFFNLVIHMSIEIIALPNASWLNQTNGRLKITFAWKENETQWAMNHLLSLLLSLFLHSRLCSRWQSTSQWLNCWRLASFFFFYERWTRRRDETRKEEQTRPKKGIEKEKSNEELEFLLSFLAYFPSEYERRKKKPENTRLVLLSFSFCLSFSRYLYLPYYYQHCCCSLSHVSLILHCTITRIQAHLSSFAFFFHSLGWLFTILCVCVIICSKHAKRHIL